MRMIEEIGESLEEGGSKDVGGRVAVGEVKEVISK